VNLSDQRGIVRGCCLGVLVLLIALGGSAFLADRALAAPVLGAPPAGPSHGTTETAIALSLGGSMAAQLIDGSHGVVVLSEQDLTVLAVANNPHPNEYRDLQVRVRGGLVVVSAQISAGPFTPTAVAHISLALQPGATGPVIAAQVPEVDLGLLGLPGFAGSGLVTQIDAALSLERLFSIAPKLSALRSDIECVAVVPGGLAVSVHDPGVPAVASSCG
jgi:hypothetical protein